MRLRRPAIFMLIAATFWCFGTAAPASAQIRIQETPALNGLGMFIFKDIEVRVDSGRGNTSATVSFDDAGRPQSNSQFYWGIFVDKPIVSHFLEMAYDCVFWERDYFPRDTRLRDFLFEPIRVVASYREGDFHVSSKARDTEYYVGVRYSLDLGRVARHFRPFQR